jgi:hypothetical protein
MESVITHLKDREIDPELELEIRDTRELLYQQMEPASNNRKDSSNCITSDISDVDDSNHHVRASSDRQREMVREREMNRDRERDREREGHRRELGSAFDLFSAEAVSPIRPGRSFDLPYMDPRSRPGFLAPQRTNGLSDTAERFYSMGQAFSSSDGAMQYQDSMLHQTIQNHRSGQPMNEQSEPRISRTANSSLTFSPFQKDPKTHIGLSGAYYNTQARKASTHKGHYVHQITLDGPAPPGRVPQAQNQVLNQNSVPSQQTDRMQYILRPHDQNTSFTGPSSAPSRPPLIQGPSLNSNHSVPVSPIGHRGSVTGSGSGTGSGSFSDLFGPKKDPTDSNGVIHGLGAGTGGARTINSTLFQTNDGKLVPSSDALYGEGTFSSSQNIPGSVFSVRTPYDARTSYSSSDSAYTSQPVHPLINSPESFQALTAGAPTDRYSSSRMTDFGRNLQLLSQKLDALDSYGKDGGTRTSQR